VTGSAAFFNRLMPYRTNHAPPPRALAVAEDPVFSSDNALRAFLVHLAEDTRLGERSARLYLGHLRRFAAWLAERHAAGLLEATGHDLRAYRDRLAARQKPASVNAALAALRRFYIWAHDTGRTDRDLTRSLADVERQPLAPRGFTHAERHRLRRAGEAMGPVPHAVVVLLLETGLRVAELVDLTWERITLRERSGWADVVGKRGKHRRVPLDAAARDVLAAIRPEGVRASGPLFKGKRGPYGDRGVRYLLHDVGIRAKVERVHPHRFRHDTARRLVENDRPADRGRLARARAPGHRPGLRPARRGGARAGRRAPRAELIVASGPFAAAGARPAPERS
jgi:site-specific recombinase XerD